MDNLGGLIEMLDDVLDTKRKRKIAGGILVSISLFFGGLAATIMVINQEDDDET